MWLGLRARRKLEHLELRMQQLEREWRTVDLEVTNHLDKITGIAKRFTGRTGGRPPKEPQLPNGEEQSELGFNRHTE